MNRLVNHVSSMAVIAVLWGSPARADAQAPGSAPAAPTTAAPVAATPAGAGPAAATASAVEATPPVTPVPAGSDDAGLTDGEAIEIFDERPDKPFDRDTEVRLTGAELAARGAVDLASALALLPDVTVRDAGRGGFNIDVRGARKGAVGILIDGVLVTDPYYGTFDVSTIPITDIVQIRVSTTPQSPIDGPGGPGGVIEVHTRDAIGPQLVIGRITADSAPSFGMTGTGRVALLPHLGLRISASGLGGARDLELPGDASIGERRHAASGAGRLEYRKADRRIAIDGFVDDRQYLSPPSDTVRSTILLIDRETTARASIRLDDRIGALQLQAQAWTHYLLRRSRFFVEPTLSSTQQVENLQALRSGTMALATRPFLKDFRWAASVTVDFEKAVVSNIANDVVRGKTAIVEAAADVQYERAALRTDLSVGFAVPYGVDARPWPELKSVTKYRPRPDLDLTLTGAYKGRVPSLRERFDPVNGNPELAPEQIAHAELRAVEHIADRLHVEVAPYYKRSTGTIRASPLDSMTMGNLINLATVRFWGVDSQARVTVTRQIEAGAAYGYLKASASDTGDDPLDRLPHHRWDAWAQVRPDPRFSALARARYFGRSIDQAMRVGGYALIEANVTAQLSAQYLAVVRVDDLLNVRPETRAGYHAPGRVISLVMQGTWE